MPEVGSGERVLTAEVLKEEFMKAFSENNLKSLLIATHDLILSFYPDPDDPKDCEDCKKTLGSQLQEAERSGNTEWEFYRIGISRVMDVWRSGGRTTFGFFSGTAGQRLTFDGDKKQIAYHGGIAGNKPLDRFVKVFGGNVIQFEG